jgi:hypothetical protein
LDGIDLVDIESLEGGDLDCHCLAGHFVHCLLHFSEAALPDDLFCVTHFVLSS